MKNIIVPLLLLLFACSSKEKRDVLAADNARIEKERADSLTRAALPAEPTQATVVEEITNWSTPVLDAAGQDSLFNILVRKQVVRGEFEQIKLITDKVLDAATPDDTRNLVAVLALTSKAQDENSYATIEYAVLAVFEKRDDQVTVVDVVDLGEGGSYGLQESHTEADSMLLTENKFAMVIHNKSSEEGAGDSGFRTDVAQLYILVNNKLTNIFERTIDDFYFASNESDSYYERTTTTTITPLTEKSKGLFNLEVTTTGDERAISDEEDNSGDVGDEKKKGDGVFKWNGERYEKE